MADLYSTLGVDKTASAEEIKKAYRALAFQYHPDKNPGDASAEEKFKKINEAYSILCDEEKRKHYDTYGDAQPANNPFEQGEPFTTYTDPFRTYRTYTYTYTSEPRREKKAEPQVSRAQAFVSLIVNVLIFLGGLYFTRFAFVIGIFGYIISISIIVRSVSGIFTALRNLFAPHKK